MQDFPFKHLKKEDIREFVRAGEYGGESSLVASALSSEAQKELMCLCAFGDGQGQIHFKSLLDEFTMGNSQHEFDTYHARRGMEKLGLALELDPPPEKPDQ